jgi:hypothetical protein
VDTIVAVPVMGSTDRIVETRRSAQSVGRCWCGPAAAIPIDVIANATAGWETAVTISLDWSNRQIDWHRRLPGFSSFRSPAE